jgi:serine/threonine protein kinase
MARRVLDQVRKLHQAGICHRDLKASDIVLHGDVPLLVDFDLGTEVIPDEPCFELLGPASGIPLPTVHRVVGLIDGVWWESLTPYVRPLWQDLGRLRDVDINLPGGG